MKRRNCLKKCSIVYLQCFISQFLFFIPWFNFAVESRARAKCARPFFSLSFFSIQRALPALSSQVTRHEIHAGTRAPVSSSDRLIYRNNQISSSSSSSSIYFLILIQI